MQHDFVGPESSLPAAPSQEAGQTLLLVALMMVTLLLFVGLGVDVANLMARRAKLQSAVDTSALSAVQMLVGNAPTSPQIKAEQIMEANGIPLSSLSQPLEVTLPVAQQVRVRAVERVETYFIRLLPAFARVDISAEAIADVNNYAEILAKPYGVPGVVNELNLMVWGRESHRGTGDAYSPHTIDGLITNPEYSQLPYGYLFRVDVPSNYPDVTGTTLLTLEIFDADSYNRPGAPPTYSPPLTADEFASCSNPQLPSGTCTTGGSNADTGLKLNAFSSGKPAFWRVDEYRRTYSRTADYNDAYATTTQYTLWHFDTNITSAFGDPTVLSDQSGGAYLSRYTIKTSQTVPTDLRWYQPAGFQVDLNNFATEATGGWYFYLYVRGTAGSSENNYDLRAGPPQPYSCATPTEDHCYVNQLYWDNLDPSAVLWETGGAQVYAKRALPLNLDTGASFPLVFAQLSKFASGQTLGVRHFDQDCHSGCGAAQRYQMQLCGCSDLSNDACWVDIAQGAVGPDNGWRYNTNPDPEPVRIPAEGTAQYNLFFGVGGTCDTSWLRLYRHRSASQDTTVWELPFFRPRIVR